MSAEERPFPTRSDVETALANLQLQLDQRFSALKDQNDANTCERDKAIVILEAHLREHMKSGDTNLQVHIDQQKESVRAALASLNQLMDEREKAVQVLDASRKEARDRADVELREKLHEMNKFRDQISEERTSFISRDRHEGDIKQMTVLSERNREDIQHLRGEIVGKDTYATAVEEWDKWRAGVDKNLNTTEGRSNGFKMSGGVMVTIITILIALSTMYLAQPRPTGNSAQIEKSAQTLEQIKSKVDNVDPQITINTEAIQRNRETMDRILNALDKQNNTPPRYPPAP